jgi:hypothetical protein
MEIILNFPMEKTCTKAMSTNTIHRFRQSLLRDYGSFPGGLDDNSSSREVRSSGMIRRMEFNPSENGKRIFNQPTNLRASNEVTPFRKSIKWNSGAAAHYRDTPFIWKEGTRQSSTAAVRRTTASESESTKNRACQRSRPFLPEIAGSRQRERSQSPHFTASRARRERFRRREKARSRKNVAFRRRGSHVSSVDRNRR